MYDTHIIDRIGSDVTDSNFFDEKIRPELWYPGSDVTLVTSNGDEVCISVPDNEETYDAYVSSRKFPCDQLCEVDVYAVDDDGGREPLAHYDRDGSLYAFEAYQDDQTPYTRVALKSDYIDEYVDENMRDKLDAGKDAVQNILDGHSGFDPEVYVKAQAAVSDLTESLRGIDGYSEDLSRTYLDITKMMLQADQYVDNSDIDVYSDMYKDVNGFRPRGELVAPYLSDEEQTRRQDALNDYNRQREQMSAMAELNVDTKPKQLQMDNLLDF